ncbi:hypothetical protein BU16DRAFT_541454 [Lophium mytilinum]|uniref:Uncharacterized protein n=1 Tax=Lophium mytilinum TaxID=390894 RepID=A0A6A6QK90_9PEZI|nr:hypothetical protein BU16DRAFT_541454 [Lophium mytilinum]
MGDGQNDDAYDPWSVPFTLKPLKVGVCGSYEDGYQLAARLGDFFTILPRLWEDSVISHPPRPIEKEMLRCASTVVADCIREGAWLSVDDDDHGYELSKSEAGIRWAKVCARLFHCVHHNVDAKFREDFQEAMLFSTELEQLGVGTSDYSSVVMLCELYLLSDDLDHQIWWEELREVGSIFCVVLAKRDLWAYNVDICLDFFEYIGSAIGHDEDGRFLLRELAEKIRSTRGSKPYTEQQDGRIKQIVKRMLDTAAGGMELMEATGATENVTMSDAPN